MKGKPSRRVAPIFGPCEGIIHAHFHRPDKLNMRLTEVMGFGPYQLPFLQWKQ